MKGFKSTGNGPKYGSFSFSSKAGFTHSGTNKQNVRGYTRSSPKPGPKFAHGGPVTAPMASGDSAVIKRTKPVTGFDAEHGGKGPLRPGFNKGGKACYAEGGKVGSLTTIAKYMKKGPSNAVKKGMREAARNDILTGGPGSKRFAEETEQFYKEGQLSRMEYEDDKMMHRDNLQLAKPPKAHKMQANKKKFAEGGKVATTGAAIKMMKELMKRGNSAEDAASKAARRYGVSPAAVKTPTGSTGGGGMPAEKQMLAVGGMAKMVGRVAGNVAKGPAQSPVPAPQGQKAPGRMTNHMMGGYGSFGRRPLVG